MMGYMLNPQATRSTINQDGWLMSGDIATIDQDGFVSITGRLKELIITSGGENVAPVPIEAALKRAMPAVSNAMVVGEKRHYLTVLLCLQVKVGSDGVPNQELDGAALAQSRKMGSDATTTLEAAEDPKWREYLDRGLEAANKEAVSNAATVKKWALLATDFSDPGGELTPTLKLKRSVAAEKYKSVIGSLYGSS
ncbi:unnamed protein product [Heterosigma akashiwo]